MTPSPPPHISTRDAKKRAPGIAAFIKAFDIIVLNESFLYRSYLLSFLPEYHVYTEPKVWYKVFNSGVVILSKVELENFTFKHYSKGAIWDWFVSKGLLGVTFDFHGTKFDLYGTHLQAGNTETIQLTRQSQVYEIVEQLYSTHNPDHAMIVCGDFNCGPVYDPLFKDYPLHYSSSLDAIKRNGQYRTLVSGTQGGRPLLLDPSETDISSFIYTSTPNDEIHCQRIVIDNPSNLSDTTPLAIKITFS